MGISLKTWPAKSKAEYYTEQRAQSFPNTKALILLSYL